MKHEARRDLSGDPPEDGHAPREASPLPAALEGAGRLRPAAEDQETTSPFDELRELGEREGDAPERDGGGGGAQVAVVPHSQHADATPRRTRRLAQERPPPDPRLEEGHLEVVPKERKDEPRGAVPRAHVDQIARNRQRHRGQDVADQQTRPLGRRAGAGQVDPTAPGRQDVEVGGQATGRLVPEAEGFQGGAVLTRARRRPPGPGPRLRPALP